jgi:ATP adenylyltransferase
MSAPLWAPWRIDYILGPKSAGPCVFCVAPSAEEEELRERLVVHRQTRTFVMLNRYPFASGHLLVMPTAHVQHLEELDAETHTELFELVRTSVAILKRALRCEGLNVGINLGPTAGAGIAEHLHVHVVPRWAGDTNFMPVIADARVVPQALGATRDHLAPYFDGTKSIGGARESSNG